MGNSASLCKSSCLTSVEESVEIQIKNEERSVLDLEKKVMELIESKIIPLIEKVVIDYIAQRFPN